MRTVSKPTDGAAPLAAGHRTVAVLGAGGLMGGAIAANLAGAGMNVRAWNRSRAKAGPLAAHGVRLLSTPAKAARGAEVVLTILAETDAVISAMDGPAGGLAEMSQDSIWLQMSTIGEAGTAKCMTLAERHGVSFVDAPVLGSRQPAEEGELVVLASGPDQVRARLEPIFDVVGERTMWLGEAGAGSRLKLALNAWVLTVVEAGAEIIALAEACEIDPRSVFDALDGSNLETPYLRMKGMTMIERQFEPAFRLALAAKDAALVHQAAKIRGLQLPMLHAVHERMAQSAKKHPDLDISATYLTITRLASLAER